MSVLLLFWGGGIIIFSLLISLINQCRVDTFIQDNCISHKCIDGVEVFAVAQCIRGSYLGSYNGIYACFTSHGTYSLTT
jgi:hypothetical protein